MRTAGVRCAQECERPSCVHMVGNAVPMSYRTPKSDHNHPRSVVTLRLLLYTRLGTKIHTLNNKNPQILPNQADIKAILPTHELIIFTKFQNDWVKLYVFY